MRKSPPLAEITAEILIFLNIQTPSPNPGLPSTYAAIVYVAIDKKTVKTYIALY